MWHYSDASRRWIHTTAGIVSDNPKDRMPDGNETALLMAQRPTIEPPYQPGSTMNPVEDCGCGGVNLASR